MAKSASNPLRAKLVDIEVNVGPRGAVEVWMDTLDEQTRVNLIDILCDPMEVTGHTKIATLIQDLGGPIFDGGQIATLRKKLWRKKGVNT